MKMVIWKYVSSCFFENERIRKELKSIVGEGYELY